MGQCFSEEKEEVSLIPNWSELCPDLLQYVFKRLSFTDPNRGKLVCSSWYSASIGCVPRQNQIPWLILFPRYYLTNNNSCVLFVPDDKDNVYKTRDLGDEFFGSRCLATYGSWLLMISMANYYCGDIYILNPLTRERIDLPAYTIKHQVYAMESCLWIDNKTKDYLVVWKMPRSSVFTKKGANKWHEFPSLVFLDEFFFNHKNQKLYVYHHYNSTVKIWDLSRDIPGEDMFSDCSRLTFFDLDLDRENLIEIRRRLAVTKSGDILMVACCSVKDYKRWRFGIYKTNHVEGEWARMDSLGDEAMILDMGITVDAKDIPGIKRNSIYFSGIYRREDPNNIFVFDLTTQKMEPLPQCVFSSIQNFSHAQWFFPGYSG